jgi:hypothetical protein
LTYQSQQHGCALLLEERGDLVDVVHLIDGVTLTKLIEGTDPAHPGLVLLGQTREEEDRASARKFYGSVTIRLLDTEGPLKEGLLRANSPLAFIIYIYIYLYIDIDMDCNVFIYVLIIGGEGHTDCLFIKVPVLLIQAILYYLTNT